MKRKEKKKERKEKLFRTCKNSTMISVIVVSKSKGIRWGVEVKISTTTTDLVCSMGSGIW